MAKVNSNKKGRVKFFERIKGEISPSSYLFTFRPLLRWCANLKKLVSWSEWENWKEKRERIEQQAKKRMKRKKRSERVDLGGFQVSEVDVAKVVGNNRQGSEIREKIMDSKSAHEYSFDKILAESFFQSLLAYPAPPFFLRVLFTSQIMRHRVSWKQKTSCFNMQFNRRWITYLYIPGTWEYLRKRAGESEKVSRKATLRVCLNHSDFFCGHPIPERTARDLLL